MLPGVLVIDKPSGMTSAAVVARVKRALKVKRVGHTGTLDPMATGVLPLCLGEATKIAGYLLAEDKVYDAELELGSETDTLDAEGTVVASNPDAAAGVTEEQLAEVMAGMVGPGQQVPPMYSALKQGGKRLYQLARQGKSVERKPRSIIIHSLELRYVRSNHPDDRRSASSQRSGGLDETPGDRPRVGFSVHCSKGTYVRSLAADIGTALGCGAHLSALRRIRSGVFEIEDAVQLSEIKELDVASRLVSPHRALPHLGALTVPSQLIAAVGTGRKLSWSALSEDPPPPEDEVTQVILPDGDLLALVRVGPDGRLRYCRVFTYGLTKARVSSNLSGSVTRSSSRRSKDASSQVPGPIPGPAPGGASSDHSKDLGDDRGRDTDHDQGPSSSAGK